MTDCVVHHRVGLIGRKCRGQHGRLADCHTVVPFTNTDGQWEMRRHHIVVHSATNHRSTVYLVLNVRYG